MVKLPIGATLPVRILITASGIQQYIFGISHRAASARLRGRSARLGLILDRCLQRFQETFENVFDVNRNVRRNAGSRLELEFPHALAGMESFLAELQHDLDNHSRKDLDGQVWFAVAAAERKQEAHSRLTEAKLRMGKAALQYKVGAEKARWNEENFFFQRQVNERGIGKDEASRLPEAELGRDLAHLKNKYIRFAGRGDSSGILVLDAPAKTVPEDPGEGFRLALGNVTRIADPKLIRKRLARHAPLRNDGQLLDFDEIAGRATGAKFLGVLKADLDNLGSTFSKFPPDEEGEKHAKELSDKLERLFTEELEGLIHRNFQECYIVYSGGDDLFMLGPWDQLIRFIEGLHALLKQSVEAWNYPQLTLSAGFRLAHPKSPVRSLAEDAEEALDQAKGKRPTPGSLPAKNRVSVFERVVTWNELSKGLKWADDFIPALGNHSLSAGFLQRFQYYGSQFRRYEAGHIDGLQMVPLLQDDWRRNRETLGQPLRQDLEKLIKQLVTPMAEDTQSTWRTVDFASRFALYAARSKEETDED